MILTLLLAAAVIIGAWFAFFRETKPAHSRGVATAAKNVVSSAMVYARAGDVAPGTAVVYVPADQPTRASGASITASALAKDMYIRVAAKSVAPDAEVLANPADVKPGAAVTVANVPYIAVAEGDVSSGRAAALDVPVIGGSGRLSTYESDKNYIGAQLGDSVITANPSTCAAKCANTPACAAWLHLADGNCWLYSNITGESAVCTGCKSGRILTDA